MGARRWSRATLNEIVGHQVGRQGSDDHYSRTITRPVRANLSPANLETTTGMNPLSMDFRSWLSSGSEGMLLKQDSFTGGAVRAD